MSNRAIRPLATACLFLTALLSGQFCFSQEHKAINLSPARGLPFSDGVIAGNTMYVAGQEGTDDAGKIRRQCRGRTHSLRCDFRNWVVRFRKYLRWPGGSP